MSESTENTDETKTPASGETPNPEAPKAETKVSGAAAAGEAAASSAVTSEGTAPFDRAAYRLSPVSVLERRRTSETAYLFDLRDVEAFQESHVPGAFSLPMEHMQDNLHRLPFTGDLIFYDGGEGLAAQAVELLHENGFTDQFYVEEGLGALMSALLTSPDEVKYIALSEDERRHAIEKVLDEKVREFLERDGGGLELRSIEDNRVLVSYFGACGSCGSSTTGTLRFIQSTLTVALNYDIEVVPVD